MEGFEADDLIATYARLASERGWRVTIVSSDKDLMQLVRRGNAPAFEVIYERHSQAAFSRNQFELDGQIGIERLNLARAVPFRPQEPGQRQADADVDLRHRGGAGHQGSSTNPNHRGKPQVLARLPQWGGHRHEDAQPHGPAGGRSGYPPPGSGDVAPQFQPLPEADRQ